MSRSFLVIASALFLVISPYFASVVFAQGDGHQNFVEKVPEPLITVGLDIGRSSALLNLSGLAGPWIGVRVGNGLRIRARILSSLWAERFDRVDSIAFDYEHVATISLGLEYSRLRSGKYIQWPVGLTVGSESASHRFRLRPHLPVVKEHDTYAIVEPWIGIQLVRGQELNGLKNLLKYLSLVLAYRIPIEPDLKGYEREDLTGPILYVRISTR